MSGIRMIVSDLDGTLLSEDNRVTDTVKDAIDRFRLAGGLFTIATGRFGPSTESIIKQLNIDIPFILCNGGVLANQDRVLEMEMITLEETSSFLLECDRLGVTVMLFREDGLHAIRRSPQLELFEQKEGIRSSLIHALADDWLTTPVQKVVMVGDVKQIREIWQTQQSSFRKQYAITQSEDDLFEILPPFQSKGTTLKKLMTLMNLESREVMSIGNQMNDLDMLENSGIGVAVANSHPELKKKASYVCSKSYGEGVVEAMERFVFNSTIVRRDA
jgi:Cof subfamily protein (haloacid dehalogenase superfamily)